MEQEQEITHLKERISYLEKKIIKLASFRRSFYVSSRQRSAEKEYIECKKKMEEINANQNVGNTL
jgi:hypothetical protein